MFVGRKTILNKFFFYLLTKSWFIFYIVFIVFENSKIIYICIWSGLNCSFARFLVDRPLILLHHLLVPVIGFPTMMIYRGGQGDCMLGTSFLVEASTPFVSLRVILVHLGLKVHGFIVSARGGTVARGSEVDLYILNHIRIQKVVLSLLYLNGCSKCVLCEKYTLMLFSIQRRN